jgi:hypothetical protein
MLGTSSGSKGATFLKIFDGRIVREWSERPQNVQDLKERMNKRDRKVYYVSYDFVSGMVESVGIDSHAEYGETIKLTLVDGADRYVLDIHASSRYGSSFFFRMMNIDMGLPLEVKPYSFLDESGKSRTGLTLSQQGVKLDYAYPKDTVPELVPKVRGGKTTYDDTDRYNFFMEEFKKFEVKVKAAVVQQPSATQEPVFPEDEMDDDLPF